MIQRGEWEFTVLENRQISTAILRHSPCKENKPFQGFTSSIVLECYSCRAIMDEADYEYLDKVRKFMGVAYFEYIREQAVYEY